jgi:hypothetical protein
MVSAKTANREKGPSETALILLTVFAMREIYQKPRRESSGIFHGF